jgi:hypothetical protein
MVSTEVTYGALVQEPGTSRGVNQTLVGHRARPDAPSLRQAASLSGTACLACARIQFAELQPAVISSSA